MEERPRAALVVMDMMNGVVERLATAGAAALVGRLAGAVSHARAAGLLVVHVRVAFRSGYPDVSPANKTFSALAGSGRLLEDDASTAIVAGLTPEPGDVVVVKRRVSAFAGSDLEIVLRSREVRTLVLAGIATSGVVLSTLREAADRDYGLVVLSDGCLDADDEVHRVLLGKVFPRQAGVLTIDEWMASTP
jgi:nicotinamidase-related amidase